MGGSHGNFDAVTKLSNCAVMNPAVLFRGAEAGDAALLTRIALAGKQHWGYPNEWMDAWRYDLTVTPEYIRTQPVRVAERAGEVIGFVGLSSTAEGRYLEHLWQWPRHIGNGFGRMLFAEAVRVAKAEGVSELRINADPNAEPFYLKMGAVRRELEVYFLLGKVRREVPLMSYWIVG